MATIPAFLEQPEFDAVRNYLGTALDDRKLFQFAGGIANIFDQYLVFRPDMIREWETGADPGWQAKLWREVRVSFRDQQPPCRG